VPLTEVPLILCEAKIALAVDTALMAAVKVLNGAGDGVRRSRDEIETLLDLGGLPENGLWEGEGVLVRENEEIDDPLPGIPRKFWGELCDIGTVIDEVDGWCE